MIYTQNLFQSTQLLPDRHTCKAITAAQTYFQMHCLSKSFSLCWEAKLHFTTCQFCTRLWITSSHLPLGTRILALSLCWGSVYSNWNTTGGNSDRNQCLIAFQEWERFFCLLYFSATRFSHNFCKVAGGSHYKCRIQAFQKVFTNLLIFISTSNIFKKVIKPPSWDLLLEKV